MDTFSQAASAFLDLDDDTDSEHFTPNVMDPSTIADDLKDNKNHFSSSLASLDSTKKRLRPKQEENDNICTIWQELKKKTMSANDAELLKLQLLCKSLKSRIQCQAIPFTNSKRKIKTKLKKGRKKSKQWDSSESEGCGYTSSLSSSIVSENGKEGDLEDSDLLYGCQKCQFKWEGCIECQKEEPVVRRPKVRWNPDKPHHQKVPAAPVYYPSEEDFQDPFVYIAKIRPEAEKFGVCMIVPPKRWTSIFNPETDCTNENCQFFPKRQLISSLCVRNADSHDHSNTASINNGRSFIAMRQVQIKDTSSASSDDEFGFTASDMPFNVSSFKAFADWSHQLHFQSSNHHHHQQQQQQQNQKLSVKQTEGEFWRLVEGDSENEFETFYGSDLDSRKFRRSKDHDPKDSINWEVCQWPRSPHSVLKQVPCDDLITGVMVPWIYFGSSLSAFCWHVEDHALYSVNYLHSGATKLWYGVPNTAVHDFEAAIKDALPHLFHSDTQLLHRLVTHISPTELQKRGIPVYRIEHRPGTFVVTFPNSYHGGFNCGWNCAEAVNFAPADWLPHGTDVLRKYREQRKPTTFSHDSLLINLVSSVQPSKRSPGLNGHEIDPLTIKYAVGELSLRIREEERRRKIAFEGTITQEKRMQGNPKDHEEDTGTLTNTEDMDCEICRCDLFLSAVVSPKKLTSVVCPEHASYLPHPRTLIYRYEVNELQEMIDGALKKYPDCEEFVVQAFRRVHSQRSSSFVKQGPMYSNSKL